MSKAKTKTILSILAKSLLWAILLTLVFGYLLGYKLILVNGWSAEPYIHYQSLIITSKFKLEDLNKGEFITYTYTGKNYITHQIIAINKDGSFFEVGQNVDVLINGDNYNLIFGKKLDEQGNPSETDDDVTTNCNIIVLQRTYNEDGSFVLDARIEYLNYDKNFVGKVIFTSPIIGNTIFTLKNNLLITFGIAGCFVLLLLWKSQMSTDKNEF